MDTDTQLEDLQDIIDAQGGIEEYEVDGVQVKRTKLSELTAREDVLLARRNRETNGGMSTRVNFNNGNY